MMHLRIAYTISVLTLLLFLAYPLAAQTSFTATLNPEVIGKDETTELSIVLTNATSVEYIKPPSLSNFIVLSGPVQQSGIQTINGRVTRFVGLTYHLKPKSSGKFVLDAAQAKADGKQYKSTLLTLTVSNTATGNSSPYRPPYSYFGDPPTPDPVMSELLLKDGESVQEKIAKNIFVQVDASKTSCYVGEPILVTYKLYTRLRSESSISKSPSFNGFSVTDLIQGMSGQYTTETLNGRQYNVYILRQSQLYPLQAGTTQLESISVENIVHFVRSAYANQLSDAYDLLGNFRPEILPSGATVDQKITLESKPVAITVKPLPDTNKPINFSGITGKLSIHALLENNKLSTDDAGKLRVVLQGIANFPLLNAPEFPWPIGITGFEPTSKQSINLYTAPVSGTKVFDYSFTVDKPGRYVIAPIRYSYFDAGLGKYNSIATDSITMNVVKGTGDKNKILPDSSDSTRAVVSTTIFSNRWMIILPLALLVFAGLYFWVRADHRNEQIVEAVRKREEQEKQQAATSETKERNRFSDVQTAMQAGNPTEFYSLLNKALHQLLSDKLNIAPELLSKKSIEEALVSLQMSPTNIASLLGLLDEITVQLYTPLHEEQDMQQFYDRAIETASNINEVC